MGMFITKIQIEKSTSPREYVTGEKTEILKDPSGQTYIRKDGKRVNVTVNTFHSLEEMRAFSKKLREKHNEM